MARKPKQSNSTPAPVASSAPVATINIAPVPTAQKAYADYTDEELKNFVINCMMTGSNYRKAFKSDYLTLLRVVNLLSTDPVFAKAYRDLLEHRLQHMEEDLLNGTYLEDIPQKFDKLGNADLSPGYLKLAEMQIKTAQWMLERRNKKYQPKGNLADAVEAGAKIIIEMPSKDNDETDIQ